jgi:hypothetical protein
MVASQPSPVRSFRHFKELQMTYSAAYFADEPATIRQQIGGLSRNWLVSRRLQVCVNRQVVNEAFELAILAPSLIAETAPLWLFWHSHLLVWQMLAIMAASWVFTWWLTWAVISVAKSHRYCTPIQ